MAKEKAKSTLEGIGLLPNGEIEQYAPGEEIPPTTYRVIDADGNESIQSFDDDKLFENDDDLDLDDDEEEGDD